MFLGPGHHVDRVEDNALKAAPEVLLVAEEDLVEVAHAADKDAVVNIELVEAARKFCPGYIKLVFFYHVPLQTQICTKLQTVLKKTLKITHVGR